MKLDKNQPPNFDGGIIFVFSKSVAYSQITSLFGKEADIQVFDDVIEVTYVEIKSFCCWEVDEFLTHLFLQCDFDFLLLAQSKFDAKILIDLSFHHYHDRYPALLFDGENMEKIRRLKASISIDAY